MSDMNGKASISALSISEVKHHYALVGVSISLKHQQLSWLSIVVMPVDYHLPKPNSINSHKPRCALSSVSSKTDELGIEIISITGSGE